MFVLALEADDSTIASLSRLDFSSFVVKAGILVFVGALALAFFRERFSQALEAAAVWIVIALLLAVGYTYRFELRAVADRVLAELVPGRASSRGRTVEFARGTGGKFPGVAQIKRARVAFLLGTGAKSVGLNPEGG